MKAKHRLLTSSQLISLTLASLGVAIACSPAVEVPGDWADGAGGSVDGGVGGGGPGSGATGPVGSGGWGPNVGGGGPTVGGGPGVGGGFQGTGGSGLGPSTGGAVGVGGDGNPGTGGGSQGTGGGGPLGAGLTDLTPFTPATCNITPTVMNATKIPMVGVATFTADLPGADRAIIQFGASTEYTLEAPVDWAADAHKTLLLGMPANTDVHYRVAVFTGNNVCVSADATYKTGPLPTGAPGDANVTKGTSSVPPAPGFMIMSSGLNGTWVWIANNQGKTVWAYKFKSGSTRGRMSWDGKYMYNRDLGPFNASSGGGINRVGMDGEGETSVQVMGGNHHDFTVTPTGIAYISKQAAGQCDRIYKAGPDGSGATSLVDLDMIFGKFTDSPGAGSMGEKCHVNAIEYYDDRKAFSVSDREKDVIGLIDAETGAVIGSVGKAPQSTLATHILAEGGGSTWRVQHGHHWYADDKIVLWTNGSFQGGQSKVLHYTISGSAATLDWQYTATGNSPTLGQAHRLSNGNFLATNSQGGQVHELDPNHTLIQSLKGSNGYTTHRTTMYGPPDL